MDNENIRTSMGKWSVGLALTSIILVSIILLNLILFMCLGRDSGESGLVAAGIIGMSLYVSSYIICLSSLVGTGLAIGAIRKTLRQQGSTGLVLNIAMLVIAVAFLLWFHISLFLRD